MERVTQTWEIREVPILMAVQDPEKRSKMQRFAGHVGEVGKDVLTSVLTAYWRQMAGI
jgi:hypothetical protein